MDDFGLSKQYPGVFPPQKISILKKNKKWRESCVDYVCLTSVSPVYFHNHPFRSKNMEENERIYEGLYNEKELEYITRPHRVKDALPARLKEYNIARPLVDSMHGEEVMRPMSFSVIRTSEAGMSERQEQLKQELLAYANAAIQSNMSPEQAQEYQTALQQGQIQPPEAIIELQRKTYKDSAEHFCQTLVNSLVRKLDVKSAFLKGYLDVLKHGEEIYYVGEEYGRPNLRRVNPRCFCYEYSPDMDYIDDASWCSERMVLSYAELFDRYGDEIEPEDMDKILKELSGNTTGIKQMGEVFAPKYTNITVQMDPNNPFATAATSVEVWKVHWKSFRKILHVSINNPETNQPEEIIVDETYRMTGQEEDVREEWVMQIWQGHRIRKDIYFGIRPIHAASDLNDPTSVKIPYTGMVGGGKSIVELLQPMQITYLSLWYRLDLLLARDNGQVLLMDITQIPKSMDIDVDRWAHMMKALGVVLVNPYESGWDVQGRDGSRASGFQGFQSLDLSTSKSIAMYIELITMVEKMAQNIIGFNPQRLGQVGHRDLTGTTEQALQESYNTTAFIVYRHDKVKERCLRKLLNVALAIRWRDRDEYLSFVGDDGMAVFMSMPHTTLETMDLYVVDSQEEMQKLQTLQQLLQPAMQAGATLADMAVILSSRNVNEIKLKLEDIENRKNEMMQQQQQQEAELKQAEMAQVEQDRQVNIEQKNADRQMKKYQIDMETKVEMEKIRVQAEESFGLGAEVPVNPLDERKQTLEETRAQQDYEMRSREMELKQSLEEQKLDNDILKSSQVQDDAWRQKLDDAKLEKEKLAMEKDQFAKELALEKEKLKLQRELAQKDLTAELEKLRLQHRQELEVLEEQLKAERSKMKATLEAELEKLKATAKVEAKAQDREIETKVKIERMKIKAAKAKPKPPAKKK